MVKRAHILDMDVEKDDHPDIDFEETFSEQFVHADSPDSSDIFGEPESFPRVGNEYQAAIPTLLAPSEWVKYFSNLCCSKIGPDQCVTDSQDVQLLQIRQSQGSRETVWKRRGLAGVLVYGLMARDLWFQLMLPSNLIMCFKPRRRYSLVVLPNSTS